MVADWLSAHLHSQYNQRFAHSLAVSLLCFLVDSSHLVSSRLSLNREGRWSTTDDFATSFLHFPLLSTALWDLANSRPVHSLMLSSLLFLCLSCLLPSYRPLTNSRQRCTDNGFVKCVTVLLESKEVQDGAVPDLLFSIASLFLFTCSQIVSPLCSFHVVDLNVVSVKNVLFAFVHPGCCRLRASAGVGDQEKSLQ